MKLWNHILGLTALVAIFSAGLVSAQEQTAGVVRISDLATNGQATQAACQSDAMRDCKDCRNARGAYCEDCMKCRKCQNGSGPFLCKECYGAESFLGKLLYRSQRPIHCHIDPTTGQMVCNRDGNGLFCNKCRRHVPMSTAPFGMYTMAYPVDTGYFDARDGGLYAAQGYGVNVTVPLAPTVTATYNYGWGVPSSRMTYLSNPVPLPPVYEPALQAQP